MVETDGQPIEAVLRFARKPVRAFAVDLMEIDPLPSPGSIRADGAVAAVVPPYNVMTLCVQFETERDVS